MASLCGYMAVRIDNDHARSLCTNVDTEYEQIGSPTD